MWVSGFSWVSAYIWILDLSFAYCNSENCWHHRKYSMLYCSIMLDDYRALHVTQHLVACRVAALILHVMGNCQYLECHKLLLPLNANPYFSQQICHSSLKNPEKFNIFRRPLVTEIVWRSQLCSYCHKTCWWDLQVKHEPSILGPSSPPKIWLFSGQ